MTSLLNGYNNPLEQYCLRQGYFEESRMSIEAAIMPTPGPWYRQLDESLLGGTPASDLEELADPAEEEMLLRAMTQHVQQANRSLQRTHKKLEATFRRMKERE